MSLVEKALKKLQDSRGGVSPSSPEPAIALERGDTRSAAPMVVASPVQTAPRRSRKSIEVRRDALRIAGLLPPEHQERQIADQYRQIKRPLLAAITGRGGQKREDAHLIMVASALPGEGKTFTSMNLALSMAMEKDFNVLLVDADTPKPHLSRVFGVDKERGLLDVLADDSVDVESLIVDTDIPRLSVLPLGARIEAATELLGSSQMQRLAAQMSAAEPERVIILDSPPLLLTQEARVLANLVGQVVLVVRADHTLQKSVTDALSYLNPEKAIGLVLNQSDAAPSEGYYYGASAYGDLSSGSSTSRR